MEPIGYIPVKGSECANCAHGRHNTGPRAELPDGCIGCAFVTERNDPYSALLPVWPEGGTPSREDKKRAYAEIARILAANPDARPGDLGNFVGKDGKPA